MTFSLRLAAVALLVSAAVHPCHAQAGAPQAGAEAAAPARDEAAAMLSQAQNEQQAGRHGAAIALFERVLALPVAPGAHPPGMLPGPVDWRGEARWGVAESRRAQGKWSEALALYQLNRKEYPRDDGCTLSGRAAQEMAITEGVCLEHLGRVDEAVALYWPASVFLTGGCAPLAMRRLVDLYAQAGQLPVLEAAVAREATDYSLYMRSLATGRPRPIVTDEDREWLAEIMARSAFPGFKAIVRARQMARDKKWVQLLGMVRRDPDMGHRREAAAVLATPAAVPLLEAALREDANWEANPQPGREPSPYVAAALVAAGARTEAQIIKISPRSWDSGLALQEVAGCGARGQFPAPTRAPRLPASLKPVFAAQLAAVLAP